MGTIPLIEQTIKLKPHGTAEVEVWTTTSDWSNPEMGCVWFAINTDTNTQYSLIICAEDYSERWARQFLDVFADNADFREQFLRVEYPVETHKDTMPTILDGQIVMLDAEIAMSILHLNATHKTAFCCRGEFQKGDGHSSLAF